MTGASVAGRPREAVGIAAALLAAGAASLLLTDPGPVGDPLFFALAAAAACASLIGTSVTQSLRISASFLCGMLAVGFLGPAAAFTLPLLTEGFVWALQRYRLPALVINLAGTAVPTLLVAYGFQAVDPREGSIGFAALLGLATVLTLLLNALVVPPLIAMLDGAPLLSGLRAFRGLAPTVAINAIAVITLGEVYAENGLAAIVFVLVVIVGFTYMARLVLVARERARQYANLSWGVLSGLIRTLNERDKRAARHCAAVAHFARDIARHTGMGGREQELAHTAGLLHDIGRFALSDRVMDRGGTLTDEDWKAIRRHPEIGADLLRDIGTYGPLSEIVIAHHERVDGRGYPHRLAADEIPPIARIIAVAEVY